MSILDVDIEESAGAQRKTIKDQYQIDRTYDFMIYFALEAGPSKIGTRSFSKFGEMSIYILLGF